MLWYDRFNLVEACLWGLVALVIPFRARAADLQQRAAVVLASVAFLAFGGTDLLEIGCAGHIPGWLWGLKIACGAAIVAARYTYRGWRTFRWRDREFLFALALLAAVIAVIGLQRQSEQRPPTAPVPGAPPASRRHGRETFTERDMITACDAASASHSCAMMRDRLLSSVH
jgi:hypothetical protein